MGFSLILRAFFSFPNERQFIECQFFWEFRFLAFSVFRELGGLCCHHLVSHCGEHLVPYRVIERTTVLFKEEILIRFIGAFELTQPLH